MPTARASGTSIERAIERLRTYTATLLGLKLAPKSGDPGNKAGLAGLATVAPLAQYDSVSVRWAGFLKWTAEQDKITRIPTVIAPGTVGEDVLTGPRMLMRVFVDIRHGKDESTHMTTLSTFLAAHPLESQVGIPGRNASDEVRDFFCDSISSETQSDVFRTTITGRLLFTLAEAERVTKGRVFDRVTVRVQRGSEPHFDKPLDRLEQPVIESVVIQ